MTLSTYVYVLDKCDPREVFDFCETLIGAPKNVRVKVDDDSIINEPGQGLCAWLLVNHGKDDWLHDGGHSEYCNIPENKYYSEEDGVCDGIGDAPKSWISVNLDTAYSYRSEHGGGCGHLHAHLVAQLGRWLDSKHLRWSWRNEFTGELHAGFEGLEELGSSGEQAHDWLESVVKPIMDAQMEGNIDWS